MTTPTETSGPKESLRDAHKDLTRERILDAAIECLNDEELDQLTMEGVAAKAGVTKRTIYRHFATREELLKASWPVMQKLVGLPGTGNFVEFGRGDDRACRLFCSLPSTSRPAPSRHRHIRAPDGNCAWR